MCVIEPPVDNSGFQQGKLVRRGKIPKDHDDNVYHWKDLNVGINLGIYLFSTIKNNQSSSKKIKKSIALFCLFFNRNLWSRLSHR